MIYRHQPDMYDDALAQRARSSDVESCACIPVTSASRFTWRQRRHQSNVHHQTSCCKYSISPLITSGRSPCHLSFGTGAVSVLRMKFFQSHFATRPPPHRHAAMCTQSVYAAFAGNYQSVQSVPQLRSVSHCTGLPHRMDL